MAQTFTIVDSFGTELSPANFWNVDAVAQDLANTRGEPVYFYGLDIDDGSTYEVKPTTKAGY